jgi:4-amino-4-deoxy-L-arabinose transferase-like glycosyltransferase
VPSRERSRALDPSGARSVPKRLLRRACALPMPLVVLLVFALVQGLAWSVMTAPLQGPDEPAHVAYAQHLAETGHGPSNAVKQGSVSTEIAVAQAELNLLPIIGHTNGRPTWSEFDRVSRKLDALPAAARKNGSGPNALAQNPPLYYVYEAIAYRLSPNQSFFGRLFAMRVANVLLYVLTVGLMWALAGEIFTRRWLQFLATAVVALQPKLASLAGNVNADTLLVAVSTGFVLAGLRLLRRGPTPGGVAAVGVLAGLGVLTHARGLALIPPALIVVAVAWLRARPPRRETLRQAALSGGALLACLVVAFLWTRSGAAGGGAFGGEVGRAADQAFNVRQFASYLWQFYLPHFSFLTSSLGPPYGYRQMFIETFFGGYANFEVNFRPAVYDWLQILAFIGFIGLYTALLVRWRAVRSRWPMVVFVVSVVVSLLALLHISSFRDLQVGGDPLITGRYLLPLIAVFGVTIAWVIGSLPRRIAPWVGALLLAGFVALDIEGFLINAQRFYG